MTYPPCTECNAGNHEQCSEGLCGCHVVHPQDDAVMKGFKRLKYPEVNR